MEWTFYLLINLIDFLGMPGDHSSVDEPQWLCVSELSNYSSLGSSCGLMTCM